MLVEKSVDSVEYFHAYLNWNKVLNLKYLRKPNFFRGNIG